MFDPLLTPVAVGLAGSVIAGPAVAFGLDQVPAPWRRTTEWGLIVGAAGVAVVAGLVPVARWGLALVYVLAALPGLIAFLALRTLFATAVVSLAPLYFVIGDLTRGRETFTPEIALDRIVPLQPAWMIVYGSLYVFALFMPLVVVRQPELVRRAMKAYLTVMLASYLGFLVYPTMAPRPAVVLGDGFAAWMLRGAYSIDPPHGCFPSLHVAYSFVSALTCYRVHRGVGIVAAAWAALIGVSTLFTKQHYVVDVIAGALAAYVAYRLFLRTYPRESVAEKDRDWAPLRAASVIVMFVFAVAGFWLAYRFHA